MHQPARRTHPAARLAVAATLLLAAAGCGGSSGSTTSTLPTSHTVSGTISGDAKAGVTVRIQGGRATTSDANGRYVLRGLVDGAYTVEAVLEGYAFTPATRAVTVAGADVTGQDFAAAAGLAVEGTLSGPGGAGATVALTATGAATRTATADADGHYRFAPVAPGSWLVTPQPAFGVSFSPANTLVAVSSTSLAGIDFAAVPADASLSGRVTGPFAAGTRVALSGDATGSTVTDAAGRYTFTGLAPGAYTVTPSRSGAAFSPASRDATLAASSVAGLDFASAATHRISGRVEGEALVGVTVALSGAGTGTATTDAAGYFEFSGLRDGSYVVAPSLEGFTFAPAQRSVTLAGADQAGLLFGATAVPAAAVSGAVSGAVQAGVTIALQGASATVTTTTDAAGAYRFGGVAPGDYLLVALHEDYLFDPASRFVVVVGAADVGGQDFGATLSPTARTISGTVGGAATAGVAVTLVGPAPAVTARTTTTDADGAFAFRGLADGQYLVTPALGGFTFAPADCLVTVAGPSVSSLRFDAAPVPRAIAGRVTGARLEGVTVTLAGAASATTTTAADGSYAFSGLAAGAYTVTPSAPDLLFSPATAAVTLAGADLSGVDFDGVVIHAISGHVTGDLLAGVTVALSGPAAASATTDAAGAFTFPGLASGRYTLTATREGFTFEPAQLIVDLGIADVTTADFTSAAIPTFAVRGTVAGAVVGGVTMTLAGPSSSTSVTTDAGGAFAFPAVAPGSYMVIPAAPGFAFTPASRGFRVSEADVVGQDFTSAVAP